MSDLDPGDPEASESRLSQIETAWTLMVQAHLGETDVARSARLKLLERYSPAIHRYLLGAVRDPDAAGDLFQEFALRLVRGDFRRADPDKGRFRHLLKTSLYHLVVDHQRRKKKTPLPLDENDPPALANPSEPESDQDFVAIWRSELLSRAWDTLARYERTSGQPYHALLRFRMDHPDVRSQEMANHFGPILGRPLSVAWVRKRLHLARERFLLALLDEVAMTLEVPSLDLLEEELIALELHEYCRPALERRRQSS